MPPGDRVRAFIHLVERIRAEPIIRNQELSVRMEIKADRLTGLRQTLDQPDERNLRLLLELLRQAWMQKEQTNAGAIIGILRRHVTNDELLARVDEARTAFRGAARGVVGFSINEERIDPATAIDLAFNGHYFHGDLDKKRRWEQLTRATPLTRMQFVSGVIEFTRVVFFVDYLCVVALRDGVLSEAPAR